jgi:uncharacterized protein
MSQFATPGVYIREKNAFTTSVVAVATAVPAFIGYTEKALRGKYSLTNKPTRISSLPEFISLFGGAPRITYSIKSKGGEDYELKVDKNTKFNLYNSIRLFYSNGGGIAYIVSVGDYSKGVNAGDLDNEATLGGLSSLLTVPEPTMVLSPDALLAEEKDYYSFCQKMIKHCGNDTKSRVAILDVYNGDKERTYDDNDIITRFRTGVGNNFLNFGAAYYPYLNTTMVQANEIDYTNISNKGELVKILIREAEQTYLGSAGSDAPAPPAPDAGGPDDKKKGPAAPAPAGKRDLSSADPKMVEKFNITKAEIERINDASSNPKAVDTTLKMLSPTYKQVMNLLRDDMNILAPGGAMAGLYSLVDASVGVHKSPANVSLTGVVSPVLNMTNENQEDLNLPLTGKAVNAIRPFVGKGTLVWGARTLDGNSQDWRYINVRRTMIMIEQSVKIAVERYVFEPNEAKTWAMVKSSIDNFLNQQWQTGALVGTTPSDAFDVAIGLGITMSPIDILDGIMRVTIRVAVSRPAEFIELTFQQKLQESGGAA